MEESVVDSTGPISSSSCSSSSSSLYEVEDAVLPQLLEVEAVDVIRLVLQFLRENHLDRSFQTLQEEARCSLQAVTDGREFEQLVLQGKWEEVLDVAGTLTLPNQLLFQLYTQVIYELAELGEVELCRSLLRDTSICQNLKLSFPDQYKKLETLSTKGLVEPREVYGGLSKERCRENLASELLKHVQVAPRGRLLALIGMALKWQQFQGLLPPGTKLDLFKGIAKAKETEQELCPQQITKTIKFGAKSHPECAAFSPDGQYLVSGSVDGFVEVWDWTTGRLHAGLEYQRKDNLMLHDSPVLAVCFSRDSNILASASQDAQIKIWKILTGELKKKIDKAHEQAITSIQFSRDCTSLLTASFDTTARIHSIRLGTTVKVFRGHKSYVNCAIYTPDGSHVVTCSSDGKVRVWDAKVAECRRIFSPPPPPFAASSASPPAINRVFFIQSASSKKSAVFNEQVFICNRCPTLYGMSLAGHVTKTFSSGKRKEGDFVDACASPRADWLFAVAEDNTVYCFSNSTSKLENVIKVHDKDVLGVCHHPHHSVLVTWGLDGCLHILKPMPQYL